MAASASRCFQVLRQTTGALYAGMTPVESSKTMRGSLPAVLTVLMLQRAISTFEAMTHLARQGKVDEAMMLGRPLFEESILLQFVATKSPATRNARIIWHHHAAWAEWADALTRLSGAELDGIDATSLIEAARAEMNELETYASSNADTKKPAKLPIKDTARELGRSRECFAYDVSSQLTRGRSMSIVTGFKNVGDDTFSVNLRGDHTVELLPLMTYWATSSALHAFTAVATMLDWQVPEQIDGTFAYLERFKLVD